jgi:hypothetical protein
LSSRVLVGALTWLEGVAFRTWIGMKALLEVFALVLHIMGAW